MYTLSACTAERSSAFRLIANYSNLPQTERLRPFRSSRVTSALNRIVFFYVPDSKDHLARNLRHVLLILFTHLFAPVSAIILHPTVAGLHPESGY